MKKKSNILHRIRDFDFIENQLKLANKDIVKLFKENKSLKSTILTSKNIENILKKSLLLLDMYTINDEHYGTFINLSSLSNRTNKTITLNTYLLNTETIICTSILSHDCLGDYNKCTVISIDVLNPDERRKGHASRQLQHLISIAKTYGANEIHGEIWRDTPIGYENLLSFYKKNNFQINGLRFFCKF